MTGQRARLMRWALGEQGITHMKKTVCNTAVLDALGVAHKARYLHSVTDCVRVLRNNGFLVRSRKSRIKEGSTVGSVRKQLAKLEPGFFLVRVDKHVILMGYDGKTLVDTAPRKRDRRKITHIYLVQNPHWWDKENVLGDVVKG